MESFIEDEYSNDKEDERLLAASVAGPEGQHTSTTGDDETLHGINTNPTHQQTGEMTHELQHDTTGITSLQDTYTETDDTHLLSMDVIQLSATPLQIETTISSQSVVVESTPPERITKTASNNINTKTASSVSLNSQPEVIYKRRKPESGYSNEQFEKCSYGMDKMMELKESSIGQSVQNLRSQTNTEFDDIPKPHDDWKFNKMLLDLAEEISSEELTKLKSMYRDQIGKRVLQQIKNASEFFDILRERLLISRDNLLHLQALLRILNKQELLTMTIEYAKTRGNVVHFYQAPEYPVNGYKLVKFHVAGKDYRTSSREYINLLKQAVSDLLFVEAKDVLIVGAMPSSSFFITLMIPALYVHLLEEYVNSNKDLSKLTDLDIDTIAIGGQIYGINKQGDQCVSIDDNIRQQDMFENVYQQLRDKTKQLENAEIKCLNLSRKLDLLNTNTKSHNQSHKSSQTNSQYQNQTIYTQDKYRSTLELFYRSPEEILGNKTNQFNKCHATASRSYSENEIIRLHKPE